MHQHKCSLCMTLWEHGEEYDNDVGAHECPHCGCHQFRVHKETAPTGAHPLGQPAGGAADPLVKLVDSNWLERAKTAFSLEVQSIDPERAVAKLAELVTRDPYPVVRLAAVEALWRLGAPAVAAVGTLTRALMDPQAYVRRAAALTLGSLGSAAGSAVMPLTGSLSDVNPGVREAAAAALRKIGPVWSNPVQQVWVVP
jgi:HEAT repeat protein